MHNTENSTSYYLLCTFADRKKCLLKEDATASSSRFYTSNTIFSLWWPLLMYVYSWYESINIYLYIDIEIYIYNKSKLPIYIYIVCKRQRALSCSDIYSNMDTMNMIYRQLLLRELFSNFEILLWFSHFYLQIYKKNLWNLILNYN